VSRPARREKETLDLFRRFSTQRARRRKMYLLAAWAGGAVLLALVIALVVLTLPGSADQNGADTSTSSTAATSTTAPQGTTTTAAAGGTTTLPGSAAAASTTTSGATTASLASTTSTTRSSNGFIVVIDPGHQAQADSRLEPVGPGSSTMKGRVLGGTRSVNTGTPESVLVLAIGLKLRDALQAEGITVIMTRTTQDVSISNAERAQLANAAGADLFVRIHANGATDSSAHGLSVLYPASIAGWTDDIAAESKRAATLALEELVAATGATNRGLSRRSDLTGFNWSDVPVFLPELGYMTNPAEDALLASDSYQNKIVQGLTRAILRYLNVS
jgi:N-acetylmuramoyl-L-alanine amidase